jgi:hypothetical protein
MHVQTTKSIIGSSWLAAALAFATFFIGACYEPRIGCLDPNATNFDVSADQDTGKCVYPLMVLKISHLHDGVGLNTDSFYINANNQKYKIREFAYYLSGFTVLSGLQEYPIDDTLHAFKRISPSANDSTRIVLTSDIGLVRRSTVELKAGTFRQVGSFDGMRFDFGLRNEILSVLPGSVRAGSVLRPQPEMLYDSTNQKYNYGRFIIEHEIVPGQAAVIDTLWLSDVAFAVGGNTITKMVPLNQIAGFDFKINLALDYKEWLHNIDWTKDMITIKANIAQNLPSGIYLDQ